MKFVLKPSLEHIALVKVVVSLWNQNDVRALISKLSSDDLCTNEKWKTIEENVTEKASQLLLPQHLKEKMLGFIKPIGLQISEWMIFHCTRFCLCVNLPAEFCWTPQGTIYRKKTAEVLVRDENLDTSTRYKLACIYCMEDDIIQFWNSMTEDLKESVSHRFSIFMFWSRCMRKRESHNDYRSEFLHCAHWGNKAAAEYFLQKLTPTERKESLLQTAKYCVKDVDTLCFFISEMDEDQQDIFFRRKSYKVLKYLLQWPLQSFFIEIASSIWDFLSVNVYNNILRHIINKIRYGYKDWNYQKLFCDFWQEGPAALKSIITSKFDKIRLPWLLFTIEDKGMIRLILKDTTFAVKEKFLYSDRVNEFFKCCIRDNEWNFLQFCIAECLPSKNDMLKFKEDFEKSMCPYFIAHFATKKHEWDQLFPLSDDSTFKYNKRSLEEGERK